MATVHTSRTLNDYRIFSEPLPETHATGSKILVGVGILAVALIAGGADYFLQNRAAQSTSPATETSEQSAQFTNESGTVEPASDQSGAATPTAGDNSVNNAASDSQALTQASAPQVTQQAMPAAAAQPAAKKAANAPAVKRQSPADHADTKASSKTSAAPAADTTTVPTADSTTLESQPAADTTVTDKPVPQTESQPVMSDPYGSPSTPSALQ